MEVSRESWDLKGIPPSHQEGVSLKSVQWYSFPHTVCGLYCVPHNQSTTQVTQQHTAKQCNGNPVGKQGGRIKKIVGPQPNPVCTVLCTTTHNQSTTHVSQQQTATQNGNQESLRVWQTHSVSFLLGVVDTRQYCGH